MGGYRVDVEALVNASWGMHLVSETVLQAVLALVKELAPQQGMVGDDEAGAAFASVYEPAARTTADQIGRACHILGRGAEALLKNADNYLAAESEVARRLLAATQDTSGGLAQPWQSPGRCVASDPLAAGDELPETKGRTSGFDRWVIGGRYRGNSETLRQVAGTWRLAQQVMVQALNDAQECWRKASDGHEGATAEAVRQYFALFVGSDCYPPQVGEDHTILANLPAACQQLAAACEAYADHIDATRTSEWVDSFTDPAAPWDWPAFGGNGNDGGLKAKVTTDTRILSLGDVAHTLDSTQARVRIPQPEPGPSLPGIPGIPVVPVPMPVPVPLVPVAYRPRDPSRPNMPPIAPPVPPDPRFPPLDPGKRKEFNTWLNGLRQGDLSGGRPADVAYQLRTAGYPEYEVPVPAGMSAQGTLMVDGFRAVDGMAIDAKYVRDPNKCYRTLDELRQSHNTGARDFLYDGDRAELKKYAAAMADPRNKGRIRGLEIDTNHADSVPYWRTMMAAYGVKGYARHVP